MCAYFLKIIRIIARYQMILFLRNKHFAAAHTVNETPKGRAPSIQILNDMAHLFGSVSKEYKGNDLPAPNGENHPLSPYRGRINRSVFPDAYIERVSGITERMKNRKQERPSLYGGEKPSLYE